MTELTYRPPSIIPSTLEEAQMVAEWGEHERAMARGDWLPEGWEWVDEHSHDRIPRDSVGAWDRKHNILVWVRPPEWTCWGCGTTDRLSSTCTATDFLEMESQQEIYREWAGKVVQDAILKVHGVGARKIIFDMVWNRYWHKLWNGGPT